MFFLNIINNNVKLLSNTADRTYVYVKPRRYSFSNVYQKPIYQENQIARNVKTLKNLHDLQLYFGKFFIKSITIIFVILNKMCC